MQQNFIIIPCILLCHQTLHDYITQEPTRLWPPAEPRSRLQTFGENHALLFQTSASSEATERFTPLIIPRKPEAHSLTSEILVPFLKWTFSGSW